MNETRIIGKKGTTWEGVKATLLGDFDLFLAIRLDNGEEAEVNREDFEVLK